MNEAPLGQSASNGVLILRPLDPADAPAMRSLAERIWREYYSDIISPAQIEYMLARMYDPAVIRQELADGIHWHWLIENEVTVGFAAFRYEPDSHRVKLNKLYLLPAHHGRGLGQQALAEIKTRAAALEAQEIYLTVNKRNARALRAYERAGFRIKDAVVADIGSGFVMDDFVMACELLPAST